MKRWTQIFRALANRNRLALIVLLADGRERYVTDLAAYIHVSMASTSRHLRILSDLNILNEIGKDGHVYYVFHPVVPKDINIVLGPFLRAVRDR